MWAMFKKDPLSPFSAYWKNYGMPGMGLFLEGYVVCKLNAVLLYIAVAPDCDPSRCDINPL